MKYLSLTFQNGHHLLYDLALYLSACRRLLATGGRGQHHSESGAVRASCAERSGDGRRLRRNLPLQVDHDDYMWHPPLAKASVCRDTGQLKRLQVSTLTMQLKKKTCIYIFAIAVFTVPAPKTAFVTCLSVPVHTPSIHTSLAHANGL